MSGGAFDYKQSYLQYIKEDIQAELDMQGKEKDSRELWGDDDYYSKYPEERFNHVHKEEVQRIMKDAITALEIAYVYAQRVDWYLSGDDGEESLVNRLNEELGELGYDGHHDRR